MFLVRGVNGPEVTPPAAAGAVFADVEVNAFGAAWIEELAALGITSGCATGPRRYCPQQAVTRDQAAVLVLRARHGPGYQPPRATGTVFADVPADHVFAAWIEQFAREESAPGAGRTRRGSVPTRA